MDLTATVTQYADSTALCSSAQYVALLCAAGYSNIYSMAGYRNYALCWRTEFTFLFRQLLSILSIQFSDNFSLHVATRCYIGENIIDSLINPEKCWVETEWLIDKSALVHGNKWRLFGRSLWLLKNCVSFNNTINLGNFLSFAQKYRLKKQDGRNLHSFDRTFWNINCK
jgi:hypothetical protein